MTAPPDDRVQLIEAITRQVMATLAGAPGSGPDGTNCDTCSGGCAARCAPKVAEVVAGGASRVSYSGEAGHVPVNLAKYIDHTLLKPDATAADVDKLCAEAVQHGFASVCINPVWVSRAAANLKGTGVPVASVIGFPFGATMPEIKAHEARQVIRAGAREIDMVINIGALKGTDEALVLGDIRAVVEACKDGRALSKVIFETALLTDEEKVRACELSMKAGADYVKTSTGFASGGATADDITLMAKTVAPKKLGVKASGGIRTYDDAVRMILAGATRIGASASVKIVEEARARAPQKGQGDG
jgi:deoxyribose-phosphate aldolase